MRLSLFLSVICLLCSLNSAFAGRVVWEIRKDVPPQRETWSCGAYAGCTLMRHYGFEGTVEQVLSGCPKYDVFGFLIGPDPARLAGHLTSVCRGAVCYEAIRLVDADADEANALEHLKDSLKLGPTIILVKSGVQSFFGMNLIQLHNLLLYGFDEEQNEFYAYDTNQRELVRNSREVWDSWSWNAADVSKAEFNLIVAGILSQYGTFPKMMIRAQARPMASVGAASPAVATTATEELTPAGADASLDAALDEMSVKKDGK